MSSKDRDLVELAKFQLNALAFCQQVGQLGKKLIANAEEASVALQDDVSKLSLHRVEYIADKLMNISGCGQQEMTTALSKTRAELDRWNNM